MIMAPEPHQGNLTTFVLIGRQAYGLEVASRDNNLIKRATRFGFVSLFVFELGNFLNLLPFEPDYTWLGLMLTLGFVFGAIEGLDVVFRRTSGSALPVLVWPLTLSAVTIDALGDTLHWFTRFSWYDQVAHFGITALAVGVVFYILSTGLAGGGLQLSRGVRLGLAYVIVLALGSVYEVEEYVEGRLFGTNRSGGDLDTANDMLMNLLGASLVVVLTLVWQYRKRLPM